MFREIRGAGTALAPRFSAAKDGSGDTGMRAFMCAVAAAALGLCASARADRVIYVAPCGDNTWSGQVAQCVQPGGPMLTVRAALDAAAEGDTVVLLDGVYTGPDNRGLTPLHAVTIRSMN